MGLNDQNINSYINGFTPGTNCDPTGDENNFVYVSQGNKFDKDVWNYNTKQISLYIDNLKKIIDFDDKIHSSINSFKTINIEVPRIYITNSLSGVDDVTTDSNGCYFQMVEYPTNKKWNKVVTLLANQNATANLRASSFFADGGFFTYADAGLTIGDNTILSNYSKGPAFECKSGANFIDTNNWQIENGCTIYHDGTIYTSAINARNLRIEGAIYSNTGTIGGMYLRNSQIGLGDAGNNCIWGSGNGVYSQQMRTSYIYSDKGYGQPSDKKLKNHIKNLIIDKTFLDFFMNIKPVEFTYKNKDIYGNRKHIGLYAQDLFQNEENTIGDFVSCEAISNQKNLLKDKENRIKILNNKIPDENIDWSLDYSRLVTPTIAVVQYQQKEIESLKKEINELKQIISNK